MQDGQVLVRCFHCLLARKVKTIQASKRRSEAIGPLGMARRRRMAPAIGMGQDNRRGHGPQETGFHRRIQAARSFIMHFIVLACLVLAGPTLAQDSWQTVSNIKADLDHDGEAEVYTLLDHGLDGVGLSVETDKGFQRAERVAWSGGMPGQRPELSLNPAGSVLLTFMNEAVGRDRWRLVITIAHRDGDWRVAGLTYDWWDTLDPDAGGTCDVNLLSGRGTVDVAGTQREVEAPWPAPRLWDWRDKYFDAAEVCGGLG